MLQLLQRRTTRPSFRWEVSDEEARDILLAAYKAEVMYRGMEFRPEDRTFAAIDKAAKFLTSDKRKFGLMIAGTCGNGKTTLMKAIENASSGLSKHLQLTTRMEIFDAKDVAQFSRDYEQFRAFRGRGVVALEDIGREPAEVVTYGNVSNPIVDLIEYRYANLLPTFVTTNLTAKEIREKYGARVADRLNEMFEVLIIPSGTFRK